METTLPDMLIIKNIGFYTLNIHGRGNTFKKIQISSSDTFLKENKRICNLSVTSHVAFYVSFNRTLRFLKRITWQKEENYQKKTIRVLMQIAGLRVAGANDGKGTNQLCNSGAISEHQYGMYV